MVTPAPETILVIGGGLGGLAFAQILRHSLVADKYRVLIFERDASPTHRGQGYQIGIHNAGAACLATIPHIASVLEAGRHKDNVFCIVEGNLSPMMQLKHAPGADGLAALVNRWKLRDALAEGLDVQWGKRFLRYEEFETHVVAHFDDGTQATGDLLVGADGVKSRVRAQRCPELQLRQIPILSTAGSVAITPAVKAKIPRVVELAGKSFIARALAVDGNTVLLMDYEAPDGETRLLWAYSFPTTASAADPLPTDPQHLKQAIDARAAILGEELAALIRETAVEEYVFEAPRHLLAVVPVKGNPLGATSRSRVTLMGDAAHAMTTHRGLGANTTFQDAFDLAQALALARVADPQQALRQYEAAMLPRGFQAVAESAQMTSLIHLTGFRGAVRNAIVRLLGWLLWAHHRLFA